MRIATEDLPDITKTRLLEALKGNTPDTFIIGNSKRTWAGAGVTVGLLAALSVAYAANDYRWTSDERAVVVVSVLASFLAAAFGVAYLIRWYGSQFKDLTFINPLYLVKVHFDEVQAFPLLAAKDFKVNHNYDSGSAYKASVFEFSFEEGSHQFTIKSLRVANDLLAALRRFPAYVAELVEGEDADTMYSLDLLYEWRMREKQYPRASSKRFHRRKVLVPLVVSFASSLIFLFAVDRLNDYYDDEMRWEKAAANNTAAAYRIYLASRPTGRHIGDARFSINRLYEQAAVRYRESAGNQTSDGIEAVIAMLDYAQRTGQYRVFVTFEAENQIPSDIENRLRRMWGIRNVVPVHPSFAPSANSSREADIIRRISTSFGRVIPGDILEFHSGRPTARDIGFRVVHVIKASGDAYYPVDQEPLPIIRRDWYTGVSFDWYFEVNVPGLEALPFHFSLASEPAHLFRVAYRRYAGQDRNPTRTEVYDAMADSAFDDFAAKLFSELSIPAVPVAGTERF